MSVLHNAAYSRFRLRTFLKRAEVEIIETHHTLTAKEGPTVSVSALASLRLDMNSLLQSLS